MANPDAVKILHRLNHLSDKFSSLSLRIAALGDDSIKEFASSSELHDQEKMIWGFEHFDQLDNILMIDALQNLSLIVKILLISTEDRKKRRDTVENEGQGGEQGISYPSTFFFSMILIATLNPNEKQTIQSHASTYLLSYH